MAKSSKLHQYTRSRELHIRRARSKAHHVQETHFEPVEHQESPPFNRFFSLPPEIRNIIYRKLLVQRCKFDLEHYYPCKMPMYISRPGPYSYPRDICGCDGPQCAACHSDGWNRAQVPILKSPARSQWAKPHKNPYLCDNCYWDMNGSVEGIPCTRFLPCLCGRHENLAILLASKRIWNEAAPIFWTENWFAFEDPSLLKGFLTAIRPQVRSWLKRISFMPVHPYRTIRVAGIHPWVHDPIWNGWADIKSCWGLLRLCEGLTELELDVVFLTRKEWAQAIRLISVKKKVTFLRQMDSEDIEYVTEDSWNLIWKWLVRRKRFDSPTTALLASSMTGDRAIKRKVLINHYSESTLHQRCGDYGVEFTEDMIKSRIPVSW